MSALCPAGRPSTLAKTDGSSRSADVDQQYLPDELKDRRYYLPTDQGYEATLANRMAARTDNGAAGKPKKSALPKPEASHHAGDGLLKTRDTNRKKIAETEKRDAGDGPAERGRS